MVTSTVLYGAVVGVQSFIVLLMQPLLVMVEDTSVVVHNPVEQLLGVPVQPPDVGTLATGAEQH